MHPPGTEQRGNSFFEEHPSLRGITKF